MNIRNHATIENGFPVSSAIVGSIQADDRLFQIESDLLSDAGHLWQTTGCGFCVKVDMKY